MNSQCCEEWSVATEVVDSSSGDRICTMCGRVLEALMMMHDTYQEHAADAVEFGPSTTLSGVKGVHKSILAQVDRATGDSHRLRQGLLFVDQFGSTLQLVERTLAWARELMRDSMAKNTVRADGRLRSRAAGCLYFACKLDGVDRSENEIASILSMPCKDLQKANKQLRKLLVTHHYSREMLQGIKATALIPRFLQAVRTSISTATVLDRAAWNSLRKEVEALGVRVDRTCAFEGKKPQTICAALVSVVLEKVGVDIGLVADVCCVSLGAVESAVHDMKKLV